MDVTKRPDHVTSHASYRSPFCLCLRAHFASILARTIGDGGTPSQSFQPPKLYPDSPASFFPALRVQSPALAESYIQDDVDIEGDIEAVSDFGDALFARLDDWKERVKLAGLFLLLPETTSRPKGRLTPKLAIATRPSATARR